MSGNDRALTADEIFSLYCETGPKTLETLDLCRGEGDFRKVYITDDGKRKLAIKQTSNAFTDGARIRAWSNLIEEYNRAGVYCPRIVPNRDGELSRKYTENGRDYYVYAEDYAVFDTAEHAGENKRGDSAGRRRYLDDMLRSVGDIAARHLDVCDFPSAYCLLEPFSPPDTTDEGTECAALFRDYVRDSIPEFFPRTKELTDLFFSNQESLRKIYKTLPVSCFQADLGHTNVLVDGDGAYAGLIDFNLSGKEPCLNYTVRAALWHIPGKHLYGENDEPLYCYDSALDAARTGLFLSNLELIGERYAYSDAEREAFPTLLRYMDSFWWRYIDEIKRIKDDSVRVGQLLDWLKRQMTRDDIRLP